MVVLPSTFSLSTLGGCSEYRMIRRLEARVDWVLFWFVGCDRNESDDAAMTEEPSTPSMLKSRETLQSKVDKLG